MSPRTSDFWKIINAIAIGIAAITVPAGPTEQQLAVLSVRLEMAAVYLKLVGG